MYIANWGAVLMVESVLFTVNSVKNAVYIHTVRALVGLWDGLPFSALKNPAERSAW